MKKLKKNDVRAPCFERMDFFLAKYGDESHMFVRDWMFFSQNTRERVVIFVKNRAKRVSC